MDLLLALAREDLHAQFFFEQLQLLAHTGLRGVQPFRRSRDIQAVVDDGNQVLELLQFHRAFSLVFTLLRPIM